MAVNFDELKADVLRRSEHIPFGNSDLQNRTFTGGLEAGTPARRVRALCLALDTKIQALENARFQRREYEIDFDEATEQANAASDTFAARRCQLKADRAAAGVERENKLIRDAIHEIEILYAELKTLPEITSREQFEAEEPEYWLKRLMGDAGREVLALRGPSAGTLASLRALGVDSFNILEDGRLMVDGPAVRGCLPQAEESK